jgi:5'-3' exonuclease
MGIRGVWTLFKDLFNKIEPVKVNSLKIGIDIFNLAYTHKSSLDSLLDILVSWSSAGHQLICVWDGVAPKEKQAIVGERRSIRDSATEKRKDLEVYLEEYKGQLNDTDIKHIKTAITSLNWQGWHMTNKLKKDIQERLGPNVEHIFAEGEADDILIDMAFDKRVDVVVSLDSDLFVMGTPRIWRILRVRGEWLVEDISVEAVCNNWGISLGILQDAAFLAGWDRCHTQGGTFMPFETALTRAKHYGGWKTVLEKVGGLDNTITEVQDILINLKKKSRERWLKMVI